MGRGDNRRSPKMRRKNAQRKLKERLKRRSEEQLKNKKSGDKKK